jgi:hypothetical protein
MHYKNFWSGFKKKCRCEWCDGASCRKAIGASYAMLPAMPVVLTFDLGLPAYCKINYPLMSGHDI